MSFDLLGPFGFVLGLGALAAALFALQRLRVRHREVEVVTTLFWREALSETRARELVQRFRHPWAYALVLLIAGLLWAVVAGARSSGASGTSYVCLLDASAHQRGGGRFAAAVDELRAAVAELPRERTTVLACGAATVSLLLPGENALLLEERLRELEPAPVPSGLAAASAALGTLGDDGAREVFVFDGGAADAAPRLLELGLRDAASGAWERVDALVIASEAVELRASLDGRELLADVERETLADGTLAVRYRDLPALGGELRVAIDGAAADDPFATASIELPARPRLRVGLSPTLEGELGPLLRLDRALELVTEAPYDVVVRRAGEALGQGAPALEATPPSEQEYAFLFVDDGDDPSATLRGAFSELGLEQVDAQTLAEELQAVVRVGAEPGDVRGVRLWDALLSSRYDFVQSQAFPLFVSRSIRWLADTGPIEPWVAAGETLASTERVAAVDGRPIDPVGAGFTPPGAGSWTRSDGSVLRASLVGPRAAPAPGGGADAALPGGGGSDLVTWILLLAVALLCGEWVLVQRGRMP